MLILRQAHLLTTRETFYTCVFQFMFSIRISIVELQVETYKLKNGTNLSHVYLLFCIYLFITCNNFLFFINPSCQIIKSQKYRFGLLVGIRLLFPFFLMSFYFLLSYCYALLMRNISLKHAYPLAYS